jgi:hypothetical protein
MSDEYFVKSEYYDDGVRFGTGSEMIAEVKRLRSELEASRHRVAELEEQFSLLKEIASNSVAALADLPDRQFAKFRIAELEAAIKPFAEEATNWLDGEGFRPLVVEHFDAEEYNRPAFHIADLLRARSTLEGKHPNAESLAAMQELEDGGGETFSSVDDLMEAAQEASQRAESSGAISGPKSD